MMASRRRLSELATLTFMIPALILLAIFVLGPALWAVYISFTNQSLLGANARSLTFVGFDNYAKLLRDGEFWNSLKVSFIFVFGSALIGQFLLGMLLAVLLRRKGFIGKGLVAGSVLLAWIIPEIVAAYAWVSFLNTDFGTLNRLFEALNLPPQRWLTDHALLSVIIANIWRGSAFSMLLFASSIETIPQEVYDAAEVDGASGWTKFRFITVPMIRYAILLDFLLITLFTFGVFTLVFALTSGGPLFRSELISIFVYRNAFRFTDLGYGSAASVMMLLINLVIAAIYLRMLRVKV
mgnify:CR=1 FL=1